MNINKYQCKTAELVYLGHNLTFNGVETDYEKIRSMMSLPEPEDRKGVQRRLGLKSYVHKFILNLSDMTAPLRELPAKNVSW